MAIILNVKENKQCFSIISLNKWFIIESIIQYIIYVPILIINYNIDYNINYNINYNESIIYFEKIKKNLLIVIYIFFEFIWLIIGIINIIYNCINLILLENQIYFWIELTFSFISILQLIYELENLNKFLCVIDFQISNQFILI